MYALAGAFLLSIALVLAFGPTAVGGEGGHSLIHIDAIIVTVAALLICCGVAQLLVFRRLLRSELEKVKDQLAGEQRIVSERIAQVRQSVDDLKA